MLKFDLPKNQSSIIKVIGVGGGGSNAVTHMFKQGIRGVDFMICNTDCQALDTSPVPLKIQLGNKGLGAGSIPEVGREAAAENIDDIRKVLENNTKMVFITAGMGGGTGTGAAPVIASLARELGILTVGIVTLPFSFEGRKRTQQAKAGIEELRRSVDTLLIICNDKLRELEGDLKLSEAFFKADNILAVAAKGIAEIITVTGYINVDFEDVKTVMKDSGKAIMGSGMASGENRALEAVQIAMSSPLLDDANIRGASNILLYISSGTSEITLDEVMEITDYIQHEAGSGADIIWGNGTDDTLDDKISITLIATGFDSISGKQNEISKPEVVVYPLNQDDPRKTVKTPEPPKSAPAAIEEITLINKHHTPAESVMEEPVQERPVPQEPQRTFTFELKNKTENNTSNQPEENNPTGGFTAIPVKTAKEKVPGFDFLKSFKPEETDNSDTDQAQIKQEERANDRYARMRDLSYKIATPDGLVEMENQPAYLRKKVELNEPPASKDSEVSRYSLFKTENNSVEMRQNNSFLHDNVD
ncbi:MAG: cell division protein FtsZ [Bacteroidetes bacterium HGW-Bacteroidetes-11]|nr:MAG: cell division protein FtsZ [Bacteroidetes bacterium HGW-Bacteroidetes-11]